METQPQHQAEHNQPPDQHIRQPLSEQRDGEAKGIPVVRTNTPRPLSFTRPSVASEQASVAESLPGAADFPVEAPAAPPVPEEPEDGEQPAPAITRPASSEAATGQAGESAPEFIWLFEYGLEMDERYLNSPQRLNGQAHLYGPAVLKGYRIEGIRLPNGNLAIALAKDTLPEREVWGVLYRIPRALTEQRGTEPSLLDNVHPAHLFTAIPVVVQEVYRKRPVQCITYLHSESQFNDFVSSPVEGHIDSPYARRLLQIARQQRLPEVYLQALATVTGQHVREAGKAAEPLLPVTAAGRREQNTEPLPVVDAGLLSPHSPDHPHSAQEQPTPRAWLLALSLYLVGLLMAALALAVIQTLGDWNHIFSASFAPLGAPWYVLLYGLLGGCISCIMALGRTNRPTVPGFVMLTWFARPFLGIVLAALAFLLLSSGLFSISIVPSQHYAISSVVGAIAGLCEGCLFFRRK